MDRRVIVSPPLGAGKSPTDLADEFAQVFGVWPEVRPWLHLIVDEDEMRLVLVVEGRTVTAKDVALLLHTTPEEAEALLQRAYRRATMHRSEPPAQDGFVAGSLWSRLDHFAKFENWEEIPEPDRRRIERRFFDEFIARHREGVLRKMAGGESVSALPNDTVLLLPEVEEILGAATSIAVQPCDCRRLRRACERPVETCLALDAEAESLLDRGQGRRLTLEEAVELVRRADKHGLMHTGDSEWRERGLHAICNCCACDCYPFRAGQELGSRRVWPRSRHVATYDAEACDRCGACVRRCHFGAFEHLGPAAGAEHGRRREVALAAERCWGCGLCANTCPTGAIRMVPWKS